MPNDDVNQKRDKRNKSLKKGVYYLYYYIHGKRSWHDYVKPHVYGHVPILCVDFVDNEMREIKDLIGRLRDERAKKHDT